MPKVWRERNKQLRRITIKVPSLSCYPLVLLLAAAIVASLPPLTPGALAQSTAAPPAFQLCRSHVFPCQQEVNLPVGGEATLDLRLSVPRYSHGQQAIFLVAWYTRILVQGEGSSVVMDSGSPDHPVLEVGAPDLALEGMSPLTGHLGSGGQNHVHYLRIQNDYDHSKGILEYGVTMVGHLAGQTSPSALTLYPGEERLIGRVTLRGDQSGRTLLSEDTSALGSSRIVALDSAGDVETISLNAAYPLAVVNTGPFAEKARLAGSVRPGLPFSTVGSTRGTGPIPDEFAVEFWQSGAIPPWRGGEDFPIAVFSNLAVDESGRFTIRDLVSQILPPGTYDLRIRAKGYLPVLAQSIEIDTSGHGREQLPAIVEVAFPPLPAGDLNVDQMVNEIDLEIIKSRFGKLTVTAEESAVDLNGDGVIDGQDFSLIAANYGKIGE